MLLACSCGCQIQVSALLRLYQRGGTGRLDEPFASMAREASCREGSGDGVMEFASWTATIGAPIPEKQRGTPKHPSFWQKLLPCVAALLELEAYRQLCFTRIAHALPDEPVEIKQWRTAATDCVYVVFVIEQVEDLHLRDNLEPLSKV